MYTARLDPAALDPDPAGFRGAAAYARTKRAQVVLTAEAARRCPGITFQAMHPGWVATPGLTHSLPRFSRVMRPLLRDPGQGADTVVWLAATADRPPNGSFWLDLRARSSVRLPRTRTGAGAAAAVWDWVSGRAGA
jgi:NAD(P)-dependent dehydrogenase (short-subunit alcohol dehydrogenase family)